MHRYYLPEQRGRLTVAALLLSFATLSTPLFAADSIVTGQSTTILRFSDSINDRNLTPLYEYFNFAVRSKLEDGSDISFNAGAWGRLDLGGKSRNNDSAPDNDLQYGYLSYRRAKSNSVINLGRQFVSEGVASERIDGLYVRQNFIEGVYGAAFIGHPTLTGKPVMTGSPNFTAGSSYDNPNLIYGMRVAHTEPKLYTIGLSGLKNDASGTREYREEFGFDLWAHPFQQLDLTGRSTYNSITNGWMEHSYIASISPMDKLKLSASIQSINYSDYFHNVTTSAFDTLKVQTGESLISTGIAATYPLQKDLNASVDIKHYSYDIAGGANYFGGKLTYFNPDLVSGGISLHRMDGENSRLRYSELRIYALKKLGHYDFNAEIFNLRYDTPINDIRNSFYVSGSAGYEINERMKIGADLEFARTPDFVRELKALVKFTCAFDIRRPIGGNE
jgi:hypothetical protein